MDPRLNSHFLVDYRCEAEYIVLEVNARGWAPLHFLVRQSSVVHYRAGRVSSCSIAEVELYMTLKGA